MTTGRASLLLLFPACLSIAQAAPTAPLSTFDLQLEHRIGPGTSVDSLVVRGSHLYFLCSDTRESVVIQTDSNGSFEKLTRTHVPKIASLDVDDQGYLYALSTDSWLTVFHSDGGMERTAHIQPNIVALALVGGKPMTVDDNDRLKFLDQAYPRFTLSSWPRPWVIFGLGSDRLAIWRPEGRTISVLQMDDGLSTTGLGQANRYVAAAGGADKHIYLLDAGTQAGIAQIHEFDEQVRPGWIAPFALPEAFRPKAMGISGDRIFLADASGKTVAYPLRSPSGEKVLADTNPLLLTDLSGLQKAIKLAGYKNTVSIQLTVGTDGVPQAIQIHGPAALSNHPDVISAIQSLRFRPKIQAGSAIAATMTLELSQE